MARRPLRDRTPAPTGRGRSFRPLLLWRAGRAFELRDLDRLPLGRDERPVPALVSQPPGGALEIEIGFGKGRFLLKRAVARPQATLLGIEASRLYWRLVARRAERQGLENVLLVCGDALYFLGVCLEPGCAEAVHVYFPDPWPKLRHQRRRLLDESTVDLVLGALAPGGVLWFATDHLDYGEGVAALLERHPGVEVERLRGPWPEGPRTHYEAKYEREGRSILRLAATRRAPAGTAMLHPDGIPAVVAGVARSSGRLQ